MIIWITIKIYESLFGITITGEALDFLRFMGFIELIVEVILLIAAVFATIAAWVESKSS